MARVAFTATDSQHAICCPTCGAKLHVHVALASVVPAPEQEPTTLAAQPAGARPPGASGEPARKPALAEQPVVELLAASQESDSRPPRLPEEGHVSEGLSEQSTQPPPSGPRASSSRGPATHPPPPPARVLPPPARPEWDEAEALPEREAWEVKLQEMEARGEEIPWGNWGRKAREEGSRDRSEAPPERRREAHESQEIFRVTSAAPPGFRQWWAQYAAPAFQRLLLDSLVGQSQVDERILVTALCGLTEQWLVLEEPHRSRRDLGLRLQQLSRAWCGGQPRNSSG